VSLFGGKKKDNSSSLQAPPPMPGQPMPPPMASQPYPPQQYDVMNPPYPQNEDMMTPQPQTQFQQPYQPPQQPYRGESRMTTEETVEAIIDEKWNDLLQDLSKITGWKERTEAVIVKMQQEVDDLKNNFDALQKSIMSKISSYDQNIRNVGVDIKAMEQVFQRILPQFTDNVNKLSRITDKISKK